ncbi:MAG: TonB family protein [bacterium]
MSKNVSVQKSQKKVQPPVKQKDPEKKKPLKKDVASKPEIAQVAKKKEKASAPLKEKPKVQKKDTALDYKEVQEVIAQLHHKEAIKSVQESVAEIQKKLLEKKAGEESAPPADHQVSPSPFQGSQKLALYHTQLWNLIHSQWSVAEADFAQRQDLEARIVMILGRDGYIKEVKLVKSSGDLMFDNSALTAIKRVGRFPAFPPEIPKESEEFEVSFSPQEN